MGKSISVNQETLINGIRANELLGKDFPMSTYNGMSLGVSTNQGELFNGPIRFRDAYSNIYKGWMFVTDASLWVYKKDLQVSVTAGITSGDENPNTEIRTKRFNKSKFFIFCFLVIMIMMFI